MFTIIWTSAYEKESVLTGVYFYSCDECRQRKIKCDGGFPCSKCLSLNKACSISKRDGPINPMDYKYVYLLTRK